AVHLADGCLIDCAIDDWQFRRAAAVFADSGYGEAATELRKLYATEWSPPIGSGNVLKSGRPEIYPKLEQGAALPGKRHAEHERLMQTLGVRSALIAPIESRGRVVGAITLLSTRAARVLGSDEMA